MARKGLEGNTDRGQTQRDASNLVQNTPRQSKNQYQEMIEDKISKMEKYGWGIDSLPEDVFEYIKKNYKKGNSEGKFYKVYPSGQDAKYSHIMINPKTKTWRNSSFSEFYGSVVD